MRSSVVRADQHFFEIPIYRISLAEHTTLLKREKQKYVQPFGSTKKQAPESYATAERWFDQHYWYPWRYNETIGWLRLYALGTQIRGELWFVKAKRIVGGTRKKIFLVGKAFESSFRQTDSNVQILQKVKEHLKRVSNESTLKRRTMDLECFEVAGPYLNWRALLGFKEELPNPSMQATGRKRPAPD